VKVKNVLYEKLVNTGNFSHEKYGIVVELSPNDKAQDAFNLAKKFVEKQANPPTDQDRIISERVIEFDNDDIPF
jgi:hypothetical protein